MSILELLTPLSYVTIEGSEQQNKYIELKEILESFSLTIWTRGEYLSWSTIFFSLFSATTGGP